MFPKSFNLDGREQSVIFFGKRFFVDGLRDFIGLAEEIVTSNQYHVELAYGSIVDAGANIGIFSAFAAHLHPDATILSFEPDPSAFALLSKNLLGYPNVKVFNFALGNENKEVLLEEGRTCSHIAENGIPVELKTIDSLEIPMNFLKMDVEGYEANIIRGASETIKKYKPIIVMSAYHKPNDKTELPAVLNSVASYDCELRHDCEEDFVCKPL
jgi:FkbM family methyltransferase